MDYEHIKAYFREDDRVTVTKSKTALGATVVLNGELAVLHDPRSAKSSNELRNLQTTYRSKGINLYYTFPWEFGLDKLLDHFRSKLHLDTRSFAAKRLKIEVIDNKVGDDFMRDYHIQGSARGAGKITIALSKDDEILAVQQFSRYRFGVTRGAGSVLKSPVWEGLRLCFKPGVQIHGGASRLQKFFEKNYEPEKIISYVNLSHSDGGYKKSQGFDDVTDWNQLSFMWGLNGAPKDVKIIDKNGTERHPDLTKATRLEYISPTRVAGGFGEGVGQMLYGAKLGSRRQLRAHPENGELVHNDVILEAIGYKRIYTSGQAKWIKDFEIHD